MWASSGDPTPPAREGKRGKSHQSTRVRGSTAAHSKAAQKSASKARKRPGSPVPPSKGRGTPLPDASSVPLESHAVPSVADSDRSESRPESLCEGTGIQTEAPEAHIEATEAMVEETEAGAGESEAHSEEPEVWAGTCVGEGGHAPWAFLRALPGLRRGGGPEQRYRPLQGLPKRLRWSLSVANDVEICGCSRGESSWTMSRGALPLPLCSPTRLYSAAHPLGVSCKSCNKWGSALEIPRDTKRRKCAVWYVGCTRWCESSAMNGLRFLPTKSAGESEIVALLLTSAASAPWRPSRAGGGGMRHLQSSP